MKANELRIGNYVNVFGYDRNVESMKTNEITYSNGIRCELNNIEPIPLTEEWLLKLPENEWEFVGFGTRLIWQHRKFRAIKIEANGGGGCSVYFNDELINIKEHVHTLQNLYFALTGEELTINE